MGEALSNSVIVKKFHAFLDSGNYRKTPERFAILNHVLSMAKPFTVEQLRAVLATDKLRVSRASVYNTVDLLVKADVLRRFFNEGLGEMQYFKETNSDYIHLICTSCGRTKDVKDVPLKQELKAKTYGAFTESYHSLFVYGTCSTCARRIKKQLRTKNNKLD